MNETFSRRLARTVGELALALLNATLILVVVGLLLATSLVRTIERVTETAVAAATHQISELKPFMGQVSGLEGQLDELRADIASLQRAEDTNVAQASNKILLKVDVLNAELSEMNAALAPVIEVVSADPDNLIDRAVEKGMAEAGDWLTRLGGCKASSNDT